MLGEFSLTYNDRVLNEQSKRSKKMWTLLQYFIAFHDREISQAELINLLWTKGESENPTSALKTQLHRLRIMLSELGMPDGDDIIVNSMGTYAFNNALDTYIDFNEFENLFKKSSVPNISDKERLAYYRQALEIYKGDFLHKSSGDSWIAPMNAYYHSLYLRMVKRSVEILYNFKKYAEVIDICRKAILIDQFDENIHYYLIRALVDSGDRQGAKAHYMYVMDLFYNQQGMNPSQEIISLYEETVKTNKDYVLDISKIKSELNEKEVSAGAFYCEYEFFKHVYQLEVRDAERNDKQIHLCLITVTDKEENIPNPKALNKTMEKLVNSIKYSLRSSDVFARYSASQFIVMLPMTSNEISEMVMQRISKRFKRDNPKSQSMIMYKYEPVNVTRKNNE